MAVLSRPLQHLQKLQADLLPARASRRHTLAFHPGLQARAGIQADCRALGGCNYRGLGALSYVLTRHVIVSPV